MDSLTEKNQFYYKDTGVKFIQMDDQDKTDMEKSVLFALKSSKK